MFCGVVAPLRIDVCIASHRPQPPPKPPLPTTKTVLQLYEDAHDGARPASPLDDPARHAADADTFVGMAQAAMEANGLGKGFLTEAELRCVCLSFWV